ncbi:MAG TPA: hypothetical protein VFK57_16130 [Vicinamibacterales bacterium]|nr:hypothetical protein [Vicinamibacterales bacterium]
MRRSGYVCLFVAALPLSSRPGAVAAAGIPAAFTLPSAQQPITAPVNP